MERKNASLRIICWLKYNSIYRVAAVLLITYIVVNLAFGCIYFIATNRCDRFIMETAKPGEESPLGFLIVCISVLLRLLQ